MTAYRLHGPDSASGPESAALVVSDRANPSRTAPRLLDQVRIRIRARNHSSSTEKAYVQWIRRFILFHGKRHPAEMREDAIVQYLSFLATQRRVSASTQNQALSALLFLYREVLQIELAWMDGIVRAKRPAKLPVVLSRDEVASVLLHLRGVPWLMASLLYGSGLRLMECARLRVKDADLARRQIVVRDGKGLKDRVTMLPDKLREPLAAHLVRARRQHDKDLREGRGRVQLPTAVERKYPNAAAACWQWIFPATRFYTDSRTGEQRRHHLHESVLQRAVRRAVRAAGIPKPASCHSLPLLRNAPARARQRYPDHPGATRTQRREHDDDLHPRRRPRCPRRPQPPGHRGSTMITLQERSVSPCLSDYTAPARQITRNSIRAIAHRLRSGQPLPAPNPTASQRYPAAFCKVFSYPSSRLYVRRATAEIGQVNARNALRFRSRANALRFSILEFPSWRRVHRRNPLHFLGRVQTRLSPCRGLSV